MQREKTCLYHRRPTPLPSIRFRQKTGFHYPYPTHSSINKSTVSSNMPENTSGHLTGEEAKAPTDLTVRVSCSIFSTISPIPSMQVPLLNIYKESLLKTKKSAGEIWYFSKVEILGECRTCRLGYGSISRRTIQIYSRIHITRDTGRLELLSLLCSTICRSPTHLFRSNRQTTDFRCHSRIGRHR